MDMKHLKKDVLRLTLTYLAIIMVMSLLFSGIFYGTATHELDRRPQRGAPASNITTISDAEFSEYLDQRSAESRGVLIADIIGVNVMILIAGTFLSYFLAERTLKPIEDNMEAQIQFVSDASHELRTPLTALRTANEVALRDKKLTPAKAREVMHENVQDIIRLQSLTDSMLGLLRDEPTVHHVVVMSEVVADAMTIVAAQAVEKHIAIDDRTANVRVVGHMDSLVRLIVIILDNAIKYSEPGTTISVSSSTIAKYVTLSITDQGMGMEPETLKHVFTRFYRADKARSSTTTSGYGLGLPIAKKIIDAHSGRIEMASKLGAGTTVIVYLPLATS